MKFKLDKTATLELLGIFVLFSSITVFLGIKGLLWLGILIDLIPIGCIALIVYKVWRYIKDVEIDNERMKAYTKYKDIRYMDKLQHDLYKEKGYIITEEGTPIIKDNIEEVSL